ncbi:hypothetical protein G6O67_003882 [Ophiocordyceps sinensis]|uniref:Cx9C motif-containing protein 4, mitochondrial n=1 Tax=Ophiocordyceps sinensis TaxID=72228 RepID=A0A8H4PSM8_9HYPO|nr:hypothetical protein G6O67_003882 [Ophiocordyceps sinensis]
MPTNSLHIDVEAKPPCHPRACAIQDCLARNNYSEAKCQDAVQALYQCCQAFYQRHGNEASSPSCPQPSMLRLKLKQQDEAR